MRRRSGFTIVELLVAMALILFMMAILSEAFVAGLNSVRHLKAVADLADRLRSTNILRRELAADHFDAQHRLSRSDFYNGGPPQAGFFRIYQGSAPKEAVGSPYLIEGYDPTDPKGVPPVGVPLSSRRAVDHMLHFTVKYRGNERGDFFSTGNIDNGSLLLKSPLLLGERHYQEEGTGVYRSQWAEVVYFLRKIPDTAKGTPLYALYRRQLLLLPENGFLTASIPKKGGVPAGKTAQYEYPEMSCRYTNDNPAPQVYFNNPRDVTIPARRFGMNPIDLAGSLSMPGTYPTIFEDTNNTNLEGADLLITDVVSFEVRVLPAPIPADPKLGTHFVDLFDQDLNLYLNGNPQFTGVGKPRVYDTWSNVEEERNSLYDYRVWNPVNGGTETTIPFKPTLRLQAIQVILRVWDIKTEQTRQITITQDL